MAGSREEDGAVPPGSLNAGYAYRKRIPVVAAGTTVLEYLSRTYRHSSPEVWRRRIEEGRVLLEGNPAQPGDPVTEGNTLVWMRPPWQEPAVPEAFTVLYEDAHLLAVDKPAGLPTMHGGGHLEHTLLNLVRKRDPEAAAVHRLGRWTSGVVLFARNAGVRAHLSRELREGRVGKRYRALASGIPSRDAWVVEVPIGPVPHARLGTVHAANPAGRSARSEVTVLDVQKESFLADVVILTGRPHQIRIHLAASGHPLVGDPLYPAGGVPAPEATALPGDPGYCLHAAEIRVRHPADGRMVTIASPPPAGLDRS